jgi:hypothetical protein
VVVTNVNLAQININLRNYAYARHAVVIPQRSFSTVNNYRNVRVTNINNTTIINNYKAAPVVNNTVINNYTTNKQRYNFANVQVKEKPHTTVIKRINENQKVIQQGSKEKASVIEKQVKGIQEGKINREVRIQQPKITNYIVPANEVNRPKSEIKLQQKEIKSAGKGVPPAQPVQVVVPQHVAPAKPGQAKQVVVPQHTAPAQPGKPAKVVIPEHVLPARPSQPGPPGQVVVPQHMAPAQPGKPINVVIPEHVTPVKPVQQPERVKPAKPEQPPEQATPVKSSEKDKPAVNPDQKDYTATKPEHVAPAKPDQKEKSQAEPGQQEKPR